MANYIVMEKVEEQGAGGGGGAGGQGQGGDQGQGQGQQGQQEQGGQQGAGGSQGQQGQGDAGKATWPENWRSLVTKDEKITKRLERYSTPADVANALIAAQNKISSGELKANTPFPEKGTDEDKAAWRTENGIPLKPEEYKFDDMTIDEGDKPFIQDFAKEAHAMHMSPNHVKGAVASYFKLREKMVADFDAKDAQTRKETEDALRAEWGAEYRTNINSIRSLFDMAPEGLKGRLASKADPNGFSFGNDKEAMLFFADLARKVNPVVTIIPGDSANQASAVEDELNKIREVMKNDRKKYNADPAMQKRYQDLLGAQQRLAAKK